MKILTSFLVCVTASLASAQTVRNVPAEYSRIQDAISASSDGDTVLVGPGTYVENINFLGIDVAVESTGGPNVTVIDGNRQGAVVRFQDGETPAAKLIGFTIRNGLGAIVFGSWAEAGGIDCLGASPHISDCIITQNEGAAYLLPMYGCCNGGAGGVQFAAQSGAFEPLLERCIIEGNIGGAVINNADAGAGGISVPGSVGPTIRDCVIRNNLGGYGGDGANGSDAAGGAGGISLHVPDRSPLVIGCIIEDNIGGDTGTGPDDYPGAGGVDITSSRSRVVGCTIRNNLGGSNMGAGRAAAGGIDVLRIEQGNAIQSCLIYGNRAGQADEEGSAGGIFVTNLHQEPLMIANCTITGNYGSAGSTILGAGGFQMRASDPGLVMITNTIIWGNHGAGNGNADIRKESFDGPDINYSLIGSGGHPGMENLDANPNFVDPENGDFHLACDSPALDAGTRFHPSVPARDFEGDSRLLGDDVDIGADEFTPTAGYCIASPNSSGVPALMCLHGSRSLATNDFTVAATGTPGTPGLFFYGTATLQVPFGDGFRCVGGQTWRLPPSPSVGDVLSRRVDLSTAPITAGPSWYFQAWYRDQAAGGAGFNLSDGLEVTFVP